MQLSLDKKSDKITIEQNNFKYSIKYDLSNTKNTFKTTLQFKSSMNEDDCKKEYSKIKNLNLIYATINNISKSDINDSVSYFDTSISKNISLPSTFSSPLDYAKELFKSNLNIQDNLFTLSSKTTKQTKSEYVVEISLSINNSSSSNSSTDKSNNITTDIDKLPQTGHFIEIKNILLIIIILSFVSLIYLKIKGNKNEQKR